MGHAVGATLQRSLDMRSWALGAADFGSPPPPPHSHTQFGLQQDHLGKALVDHARHHPYHARHYPYHARHYSYHATHNPNMLGDIPNMLGTTPTMLGTTPTRLGTTPTMHAR